MATKTFTISRDKAVALLTQLGLSAKAAAKLDDAKLVGKLSTIDDSDEDADPGKYRKIFEKLVSANKKEHEIEIEGGAPVKASKKKAKPAKEEEEDEDEEEEAPKKKGKKGKAAKASKAESKPAKKRTSESGPSNKELVYKEWKKRKGEAKTDYTDIMKVTKTKNNVKDTTVRAWLSAWARGDNLPGCAK